MTEKEIAIQAAKEAGAIIKKHFMSEVQYEVSDHTSVTTQVDRACERHIISVLNKHTDYSVLGEEFGASDGNEEKQWIIDPIDGTTNFFMGMPAFAVSIALRVEKNIEVGVIYQPLTGDIYHAERGKGFFVNKKRVQMSNVSALDKYLLFLNHGYDMPSKVAYTKAIRNIVENAWIRTWGSAAYELALFASGVADASISHGNRIWDVASGVLFVQEAGGIITDWKGNPFVVNDHANIVAAKAQVHPQIIEWLSEIDV